jgi:hypothetical protein
MLTHEQEPQLFEQSITLDGALDLRIGLKFNFKRSFCYYMSNCCNDLDKAAGERT